MHHEEIEYEAKDGRKFQIRAQATRGDKYEMNTAMSEGMEIVDGKVIKAQPGILYPWLIRQFVLSCSSIPDVARREILDHLLREPADAEEDLIMVLGAFILNHVKGLIPQKDEQAKKKD